MAETTDRPPDPNGLAAPLPAAPARADEAPKAYSSLSLLALGGLGVAVVYAVVVRRRRPPSPCSTACPGSCRSWSLAVPLAAVVLCWAARVQIQNSEGALTGTRLTVWGLWLSLAVGLLYAAYYSACYLSVTRMADRGRRRVVRRPQERPTRQGVPARPAAAAARRRRRPARPAGTGIRPRPRRRRPVHRLSAARSSCARSSRAGPPRRSSASASRSGATAGGYQVQLAYRVSTPYMSFRSAPYRRRAWTTPTIPAAASGTSRPRRWTAPPVLTAEGRRMADQVDAARSFGPGLARRRSATGNGTRPISKRCRRRNASGRPRNAARSSRRG